MTDDAPVLGTGAYGDPANPAQSREEFENKQSPVDDAPVVPDPPLYDDSDDD